MLVNSIMTTPVISVHESTQVAEALELLRQNKFRHLPIINDQEKLVGLATEWDMLKVFSGCSIADRLKTNLVGRTPVSSIMETKLLTVAPHETVEKAALIMEMEKSTSLVVVENDNIIGIISVNDILRALVEALGIEEASVRITIKFKRNFHFLADLIKLVDDCRVVVQNILTFHETLVLKVKNQNFDCLLEKLKAENYQIEHITYIDSQQEATK